MKLQCDHSVDCRKLIHLILDKEATPEQVTDFMSNNMETCRPCIEMYHLEKEIKELLQGRMEKRCCPEKLVATIRTRILSFS